MNPFWCKSATLWLLDDSTHRSYTSRGPGELNLEAGQLVALTIFTQASNVSNFSGWTKSQTWLPLVPGKGEGGEWSGSCSLPGHHCQVLIFILGKHQTDLCSPNNGALREIPPTLRRQPSPPGGGPSSPHGGESLKSARVDASSLAARGHRLLKSLNPRDAEAQELFVWHNFEPDNQSIDYDLVTKSIRAICVTGMNQQHSFLLW